MFNLMMPKLVLLFNCIRTLLTILYCLLYSTIYIYNYLLSIIFKIENTGKKGGKVNLPPNTSARLVEFPFLRLDLVHF